MNYRKISIKYFKILSIFILILNFSLFAYEDPVDPDPDSAELLGDIIQTVETTLYHPNCDSTGNPLAYYSGANIHMKVSSRAQASNKRIVNSSRILSYDPYEAFMDLNFPRISNIVPNTNDIPGPQKNVVVVKVGESSKIKMPNEDYTRGDIVGQLISNMHYQTISTVSSSNPVDYVYKILNGTTNNITLDSNILMPAIDQTYVCFDYYVAYCGDGIVDNPDGPHSGDGKDGILDQEYNMIIPWSSVGLDSVRPNEVCDDGPLNGQPGKCKIDCSGLDDGGDPDPDGEFNVTKTLTDDRPYSPGENLQFRINFANNIDQTLQDIVIEDILPSGFEYISSQINGHTAPVYFSTGIVGGNTIILYTGFTLSPGQNGYITINAKLVSCNQTLNNVFWTGMAGGIAFTGYTNKNVSCSTTPVSITKSVSNPTINLGGTSPFTIQVNNATPNTITNVNIQDIWPVNGCLFITGQVTSTIPVTQTQNGNITQWALSTGLTAGQAVVINFHGQAGINQSCIGTHANTAKVIYTDPSGNQQQENIVNVTITQPTQSMSITKTLTQEGSSPGDMVRFTITYRNTGPTPIHGFRVVDYWPLSLDFVSSTPRPVNHQQYPLTRNFSNTLQPGGSGSIEIIGRIKQEID